jgi:NADH:ubiquinone oxidoreductase subunit D
MAKPLDQKEKPDFELPPDRAGFHPGQTMNVSIDRDPNDLWDDSRVLINIGPTHPAMHGAFRMMAKVNGETIEKSYSEFGYTHRAKEKLGENRTYHQFVVYTDRLNYCSALLNNVAYSLSVERLLGVEVPPRTVWIRMMCSEIARVMDHLVCVGINAVDLGAFSFFLYGFHQREEAYSLIEKLCRLRRPSRGT